MTPEDNDSISRVLKNTIDWASRPAFDSVFTGKPCFVVTVSGGVRAHLKYVLDAMLANVFTCNEIVMPMANAKIADGIMTDTVVLDFAMENLNNFVAGL